MRVMFSADWHIKLNQKNVPIEWQLNRYRLMFEKMHEQSKGLDLVIIGGDIFDTIPSMQELSLFFDYLARTTVEHIIYDGNHEATKKGKTFLHYLIDICSGISNTIVITEPCTIYGIDFIPYTHLKTFDPNTLTSDILCTHVRGEIPPHVKPEIDLSKLDKWKVVLAGDLHAYSNSQRNILYPGSPLTITFHRNEVKNGLIIMDTDSLEYEWVDLGLPQLLRKTVSTIEGIVPSEYHHTIYEVEGNILELSRVDTSSSLFDKKVVKGSSTSKLLLSDMSIVEELDLYLSDVLDLSKADIEEALKVYNDYT